MRGKMGTQVVVMGFAGLLVASAAHGDGPAKLTPEQEKAKAEFIDRVQPALNDYKQRCGTDVALTSDFENYDASSNWFSTQCQAVLREVAMMCKEVVRDGSGKPVDPPRKLGGEVKKVECLYGGFSPKQTGERLDAWAQRNMSFSNGTFTFHDGKFYKDRDSRKPVFGEDARAIIVPPAKNRENGRPCSTTDQCRSSICKAGTCAPCSSTNACAAGLTCSTEGACFKPSAPSTSDSESSSDSSSSSSSSSSPSPSPRHEEPKQSIGGTCHHNADCQSKHCSISPHTLHQCVAH